MTRSGQRRLSTPSKFLQVLGNEHWARKVLLHRAAGASVSRLVRSQFEALEHHAFGPEYAFDEAIDKIAEDEGRDKQADYSRYQFQYVHSPAVSLARAGALNGGQA